MRVSSPGLRLALLVGFGGMLLISLIAGVDALRLLRQMRVENRILLDASVERSRRLSSIRSYVLLSDAYVGDYLFDADQDRAGEHLTQLRDTWSHVLGDLGGYRMTTVEETILLKKLRELLDQHWQDVSRALATSEGTATQTSRVLWRSDPTFADGGPRNHHACGRRERETTSRR